MLVQNIIKFLKTEFKMQQTKNCYFKVFYVLLGFKYFHGKLGKELGK